MTVGGLQPDLCSSNCDNYSKDHR